MSSDTLLTAIFERITAKVVLERNDEEAGEVEGAGSFACGTNVPIRATPNEGYYFAH